MELALFIAFLAFWVWFFFGFPTRQRRSAPKRQPAPPLNPRWDTSACRHAKVEPVIPSGEEEAIAYLCANPECYAQLELTDRAVIDYLKQERVLKGWESVQSLGNSSEQAQAFAARTRAIEGGPYVQVMPSIDRDALLKSIREAVK